MAKLQGLLERGVQVLHHEASGKIVEAVLSYSAVSNDLELYSRQDGIFSSKETKAVRPLLSFCTGWFSDLMAIFVFRQLMLVIFLSFAPVHTH